MPSSAPGVATGRGSPSSTRRLAGACSASAPTSLGLRMRPRTSGATSSSGFRARVEGAVRTDVARASDVTIGLGATVAGPVLTRVRSRAASWYGKPR